MRPRKVILVVDDNEQVLSTRCFLLETMGYRALRASGGLQAIAILNMRVPGSLHLLLTDLVMPLMDGNELCRRAKQLHPSLPVMIVSGTISDPIEVRADGFSLKGSKAEDMLYKIKILVARKRGPKKVIDESSRIER